MPLTQNKPHVWLQLDNATGSYRIYIAAQLAPNNQLTFDQVIDNFGTRTRTLVYAIKLIGGSASGFWDGSFDNNPAAPTDPFSPSLIDYITIDLRYGNEVSTGRSTVCTSEADAT